MATATATESRSSNINAAVVNEWRRRPDDERFLTLDDLYRTCLERADRSACTVTNTKRIRPIAMPMAAGQVIPDLERGRLDRLDQFFGLLFETEAGVLDTTHWSFGQVARSAGVPVDYLRKVDARKAVADLDYGFAFLAARDDYSLFTERVPDRGGLLRLRSMNGKSFGRVYDHEVVDMVRNAADPNVWQPPVHAYSGPAGSKKATTLYASDRDVSIFLVDDKNPIEISVGGKRESLARGILVRNSEVGLTRFRVVLFFYRYECDNRLLWAPSSMQEIGITHTSGAPERFRREAAPMLERFARADVSEVAARIEAAMKIEVGRDKDSVTDWLVRHGFTKNEGGRIYDRAEEEEGQARTVWDLINGGTALARTIPHTDTRLEQEARFGALLGQVAA